MTLPGGPHSSLPSASLALRLHRNTFLGGRKSWGESAGGMGERFVWKEKGRLPGSCSGAFLAAFLRCWHSPGRHPVSSCAL